MPKLAIVGTIEVAQGRRDQLLALKARRARCLKNEFGITLQFEALLPRDNDTKFSCTKFTETAPPWTRI